MLRAAAVSILFAVPAVAGESDLARRDAALGFATQTGTHLLGRVDEIKTDEAYDGGAGVALFFFDLHRTTKEKRWLPPADKLLDRSIKNLKDPGLYTGLAGAGQVCLEAWRATKDEKYLGHAKAVAARLGPPKGADIIFGAAGTGIFLLNLHKATKDKKYLDQARALGAYLEKNAVVNDGAASWPVAPGSPRTYLGFSHGAAGIGYFFLHLHLATKEKKYAQLSEQAARFVIHHAVEDGVDGWKWTKLQPRQKDVYPVQWCHGSPGNGLFFNALHQHLGGETYGAALMRCVAANRRTGRKARASGCICHGVAGNAELFLEVYLTTGDESQLAFPRAWAKDLIGKDGVKTAVGRWKYGPGYMTGLAGIGRFFLRLAYPKQTPMAFMVWEN